MWLTPGSWWMVHQHQGWIFACKVSGVVLKVVLRAWPWPKGFLQPRGYLQPWLEDDLFALDDTTFSSKRLLTKIWQDSARNAQIVLEVALTNLLIISLPSTIWRVFFFRNFFKSRRAEPTCNRQQLTAVHNAMARNLKRNSSETYFWSGLFEDQGPEPRIDFRQI